MLLYQLVSKPFGGARRDRTADLLHAMQALSQLSYGPKPRNRSAFLLVFDVAADDIRDVGVFFLLLLDKSGIVEGFVDLDLFFDIRPGRFYRRLRALRLSVGFLQGNEFGLLRLRRDDFFRRNGSGGRTQRSRFGTGSCRGRFYRHYLTGIGRNDRILVEVVELASGFGTDAFSAKFRFRHGQKSFNL